MTKEEIKKRNDKKEKRLLFLYRLCNYLMVTIKFIVVIFLVQYIFRGGFIELFSKKLNGEELLSVINYTFIIILTGVSSYIVWYLKRDKK